MKIKSFLENIAKNNQPKSNYKSCYDPFNYHYRFVDFSNFFGSNDYNQKELSIKDRRNISISIYKLKKQGFIEKKNIGDRFIWIATKLGLAKLEKLNKLLPRRKYVKQSDKYLTMVSFDIPERLAHLRKWLSYNLTDLGFEKLQKSVWIGKVRLTEDFIKDIHNLKINKFISIFHVIERGL